MSHGVATCESFRKLFFIARADGKKTRARKAEDARIAPVQASRDQNHVVPVVGKAARQMPTHKSRPASNSNLHRIPHASPCHVAAMKITARNAQAREYDICACRWRRAKSLSKQRTCRTKRSDQKSETKVDTAIDKGSAAIRCGARN